MTESFFPEPSPTRPVWLVTLADLALLLVGFFVLVQANQTIDKRDLAKGLREGFGVSAPADEPMPVAAAAPIVFATGSSEIAALPGGVTEWASTATNDPSVTLRITASVDGSESDIEAVTGSGAVLAADRARAVAAALSGVVPAGRIAIATASAPTPGRRGGDHHIGFRRGAAMICRPATLHCRLRLSFWEKIMARFTRTVLMASALGALSAPAAAQTGFQDTTAIDRAVQAFTGKPIGVEGGARTIVDGRLKLASCPMVSMAWRADNHDSVVVTCTGPEWRLYVPVIAAPLPPAPLAAASVVPAKPVIVIKRGDPIMVEAISSGFSITREGIAMGDAPAGGRLLVDVDGAKKPVQAIAVESGRATLPGYTQ